MGQDFLNQHVAAVGYPSDTRLVPERAVELTEILFPNVSELTDRTIVGAELAFQVAQRRWPTLSPSSRGDRAGSGSQ